MWATYLLYWFCLLSTIQQIIDYKFSVVSRHRTLMNIFDKAPVVDKDAFVAPSASVIGDVQVGRGSSIWYGCVLRGKTLYAWILLCLQNLKLWLWPFILLIFYNNKKDTFLCCFILFYFYYWDNTFKFDDALFLNLSPFFSFSFFGRGASI